jgi:hypothetical protein
MTKQSASSGWWARFTFNGITRYERGTYDLVGREELNDAERDVLLQLCRQRLDAFREQRGEEVTCLLIQKPAASATAAATARRSAARSKSGCSPGPKAAANAAAPAVAQQTPQQRALEVDHIVPRNHGGSATTSATCRPSASSARPASYGRREAGCVFCALEASGRVLLENELALCIVDAYPVTPGHSLVIPRRHGADGLALHQPEWNAVVEPIAKRMHMSYVGKRFIGGEFNDIQCLTTNAFRFSSMRTWVSNSRFSSDRTRSSRVVRSWLPMLPVATIKSLAGVPCKR